ncbi:MAG: hypothetical protein IPK82_38635 [Polyangiaceae bacterium]|nr:hypothetical protein [Polyangiaceae bacterium]
MAVHDTSGRFTFGKRTATSLDACVHMTLQQVIYERPPEGLSRGKYPAPWWVILLIAVVVVLAAVTFLTVRYATASRAAKGPSAPPKQ